jgi:hypothetical protein
MTPVEITRQAYTKQMRATAYVLGHPGKYNKARRAVSEALLELRRAEYDAALEEREAARLQRLEDRRAARRAHKDKERREAELKASLEAVA